MNINSHIRLAAWLLALAVGLGLAATPAAADSVTWTFQNISACCGSSGQITGSFLFDGSSITSWNIGMPYNTSPFTVPGETLTTANSSQSGNGAAFTLFESNDGNYLFYIVNGFDPGTPGTVSGEELIEQYQATPNNYYEVIFDGDLQGTGSQVTPEPATWGLMGTGLLALLGLGLRQRRRGYAHS